jgi:hypothetical protein
MTPKFWNCWPDSRREWLLLVAIIMLLEFVYLHTVYTYGQEKDVLSYWSFAGTILGIVLAFVAIIFSFIQTALQQSSASAIAANTDQITKQVNSLQEVTVTVRSSTNELHSQLGPLRTVAADIQEVLTRVRSQDDVLKKMESSLGTAKSELNEPKQPTTQDVTLAASYKLPPKQLAAFAGELATAAAISFYALIRLRGKLSDNDIADAIANAIVAMDKEPVSDEHREWVSGLWFGSLVSARQVFYTLGIADSRDEYAKLASEYQLYADEAAKNTISGFEAKSVAPTVARALDSLVANPPAE